jgi:transposase
MRKIKEVLRLKHEKGLSDRQIALSCSIARSTVGEYLMRARVAGITWPVAGLDDSIIEARLFPVRGGKAGNPSRADGGEQPRPTPNFGEIHKELKSHKHVTLQLLWQEYKQASPDGYQYSQFCEQYRKWTKKADLVLRQTHRAGEKLFVDYAGQTAPVVDPKTGEEDPATVFVAVLGASNYTYADATLEADLESWIESNVRAMEYIGGCPEIIVPDNLKAGVKLPSRYEPDLNPTYQEMAAHYGVAVIPARVRKPRDKAKVEAGVQVVERWILAALRKRTFFSIGELNQAIKELLEKLNARQFRKMPGSRRELFEQLDRPALRPLPVDRFEFAHWKWARVSNDYHVELEHHYYSVPNSLAGRLVEIRYTAQTVEVLHQGVRVASHARSNNPGITTVEDHRPESHRRYLEWTPERLASWATHAGAATAGVVERVLENASHREQGLRSCLGLVRLGESYGRERLEAACERALRFNACSYKSVESILKTGMDRMPGEETRPASPPVVHDNLRDPTYFDEKETSHVN